MKLKQAVALALVVSLTVSLSGCTPKDRAAATIHQGSLTFEFCDGYSFDALRVVSIDGNKYETLWLSSGAGITVPGQQLVYGLPPEGQTTEQGPMNLSHGMTLGIYLERHDADGALVQSMYARFDYDSLGEWWVDEGGIQRSQPCA